MKVKSESEVTQSCPTLSDPMDGSLPGSSVHGIFQARVLEWGAIAFSEKGSKRFHKKVDIMSGNSHLLLSSQVFLPDALGYHPQNTDQYSPTLFHALEKEMATHSSVLAWRIPGAGEPGGLPSLGLHRVGHD